VTFYADVASFASAWGKRAALVVALLALGLLGFGLSGGASPAAAAQSAGTTGICAVGHRYDGTRLLRSSALAPTVDRRDQAPSAGAVSREEVRLPRHARQWMPISATPIATNSIAGIETRFGLASQGADAASVAARAEIEGGARIWRIGTTGQSQAAEAQFWTTENPASPGFASRYGIPESNVANSDFIESAVLKPGTPFVTRPAPGVGSNLGGGVEVVVPEGGVTMCSFSIVGPKGC